MSVLILFKLKKRSALFLLLAILATQVSIAQEWFVRVKTPLRSFPAFSSKQIGSLAEGKSVTLMVESGRWLQVATGKQQGWVRSYTLRAPGAYQAGFLQQKPGSPAISLSRKLSFSSLYKQEAITYKTVVATIGVRGMSADELLAAQPDWQRLKDSWGSPPEKSRLQEYAEISQLKPRKIEYIE